MRLEYPVIYDPSVTEHTGRAGSACLLPVGPEVPNATESVAAYLITAPCYHPLWSQYRLDVIRLRDMPDMPPPVLKFQGATHEIMVMTLNPEHGPWTADLVVAAQHHTPFLTPINVAEQFEATDEEMRAVADLLVQSVVHGILTPESADAPSLIRRQWLTVAVKTLAHLRGEPHAS